jgi:hypothetical protein
VVRRVAPVRIKCIAPALHTAHYAEAIILPDRETGRAGSDEQITLGGERVIVVSSNGGLGMYVTGHAVLTAELMRWHHPNARIVKSVALVPRDDSAIRPLYDAFPDVEPEVLPPE